MPPQNSYSFTWIPQLELLFSVVLDHRIWCLCLTLSSNLKEYSSCYACSKDPLKTFPHFLHISLIHQGKAKGSHCREQAPTISTREKEWKTQSLLLSARREMPCRRKGEKSCWVSIKNFIISRLLPGPHSDYSKTGRGKDTLTRHLIRGRAREQSMANPRKL